MPRQRLALPSGLLTGIGQRLMALVGLALIYGGAVSILLASGVRAADVERYSGYHRAYHALSQLDPRTWADLTCALVGVGGVLVLLLLLALGWAQRLLPARTRAAVLLSTDELGQVTVSARAVERAAEIAAGQQDGVRGVRARLGRDELTLIVHTTEADGLPAQLRAIREHAGRALLDAGVPQGTVSVCITRFSAPTTRETLR